MKKKIAPQEVEDAPGGNATDNHDPGSSEAAQPADGATPPEDPEQAVQKLEAEKQELYDQLLRQRAEFENVRKRLDREALEKRRFAEAALVESLLPVLDSFERALASMAESGQEDFVQGAEMIYKQLQDTLTQAGLKSLPAVGQTFDPMYHHAVERVETTDHDDQQIVEELQRGYLFKDRLLRPALVKVAVRPVETSPETE